jgi:hypothetical protein
MFVAPGLNYRLYWLHQGKLKIKIGGVAPFHKAVRDNA